MSSRSGDHVEYELPGILKRAIGVARRDENGNILPESVVAIGLSVTSIEGAYSRFNELKIERVNDNAINTSGNQD